MWVTIYTDASFHQQKEYVGIAFRLRSDNGRLARREEIPFDMVSDNNHAEMLCITKATKTALAVWKGVEGIQINTDSQAAITVLKWRAKHSKKYREVQREMQRITEESGVRVKFKHVSGHKGTETTRHWLNNWCDNAAKKMSVSVIILVILAIIAGCTPIY